MIFTRPSDFEIEFGDVVGILEEMGNGFIALNAGSDFPIGTEDDVLNFFFEDGRSVAVGFPNDDIFVEGDGAIGIHGAQAKLGKIHNDRRLREGMGNPAPALEGEANLADAGGWRRV
jgi:hypothetical protein